MRARVLTLTFFLGMVYHLHVCSERLQWCDYFFQTRKMHLKSYPVTT